MTHALRLAAIFVLSALSVHLALVLLGPRSAMNALMSDLEELMRANQLYLVQGETLRRLVRHPAPQGEYAACLLDLAQGPVQISGPAPRSYWSLTVHAPNGDVVYAITDRHLPPGKVRIRFEPQAAEDEEQDGIALAVLERQTLRVPLPVRQAIAVVEAIAWHPGQMAVIAQQMRAMRCEATPSPPPPPSAGRQPAPRNAIPQPRPRPRAIP